MKIVNIEKENLNIFWTTNLEKPQWEGVQIDPTAFLGLKNFLEI